MKKYLVRDILEAEPMPMNEYVKLVQKEVDDVPNTDGYHVKYANGKTTWLEKNDFEKNAIPYDDWKERLAVELQDLEEKAIKLEEAFKSHKLNNLTEANKALLNVQLILMKKYHSILRTRYTLNQNGVQPKNVYSHSFSDALEALREGLPVSRSAWLNSENKKVIFSHGSYYVSKRNIPNLRYLSGQIKRFLNKIEDAHIVYEDYLASINSLMEVSPWSPSAEDIVADDWIGVHDPKQVFTEKTEAPEEQGQKSTISSHD
jgi:hypothetical protein